MVGILLNNLLLPYDKIIFKKERTFFLSSMGSFALNLDAVYLDFLKVFIIFSNDIKKCILSGDGFKLSICLFPLVYWSYQIVRRQFFRVINWCKNICVAIN